MNLLVVAVVIFAIVLIITMLVINKKQKSRYKKLLKQKKQSEILLGYVTEKLAPFLDDFKYDAKDIKFLGQPIDYIHFGEETITFIEVKSGNSQLNKKQREIRDIIKAKNVAWDVYRVSGKTNKIKHVNTLAI